MSWDTVNINDICRPRQWKTLSIEKLKTEGYPVYGANGKIGFYNEFSHEHPTLAITCRGATCGSVHITEPMSYINGNAMALDNISEKIDIKFLYYFFLQRGFNDVISGSAQPQITGEGLSKVEIPLPPLPIQKRIAEILDAADSLKRKDQALLKKYDELAQAIFIDMFGDPVKNEKRWEVKTIQDLINLSRPITYGILKPGEDLKPNGVPYIRVVDIKGQKVLTEQVCYTSVEISNQYKRSLLKEGDILYSIRGHVGRSCLVPHSMAGANITQDTARLDFTGNLNNVFAFGYLNTTSFDRIVRPLVRGAAVKGLNLGDLRELPIPIPPMDLQAKYEKRMNLIWQQNDFAKESAINADNYFDSLIQKAFNGELVN